MKVRYLGTGRLETGEARLLLDAAGQGCTLINEVGGFRGAGHGGQYESGPAMRRGEPERILNSGARVSRGPTQGRERAWKREAQCRKSASGDPGLL
jgi:hypothetical protein